VAGIRAARVLLGSSVVRPTAVERGNKREYQRRLVAARDIRAGEILDETALTLRRVAGGRGLPPGFREYLLGRPAPRMFRAGEPIEL
jgi:sialic acid synthase SpsE